MHYDDIQPNAFGECILKKWRANSTNRLLLATNFFGYQEQRKEIGQKGKTFIVLGVDHYTYYSLLGL